MKYIPNFSLKFSFKKVIGRFSLFLAGLLLGAFLFMPWEVLWSQAFAFADSKISKATIQWGDFVSAGPLSFEVTNLLITTDKGLVITVPQLGMNLGLSPLLELRVKTGPTLSAKLFQTKSLTLNGGVDLAKLVRMDGLGGKVRITSDVGFPKWGAPPRTGSLVVRSDEVEIPGGLIAEDINVNAVLSGNQFQLNSFSCGQPIPVTAKGSATLNWKQLPQSSYNISGSVSFGSTERQFSKSGNLSKYLNF
ncbi:conserved exported protein of unknown function [Maridesulfovibrio hydrothermalis AM13 = DSM 14728]|uniref:Type II secretion system protein N n=2 Tax=Maridesulfovibrio TaxID=2794998 RepID=L0R927_9BACT|nr:conserved exported protein of unknown function [Maridesulfovibrio hydrothermalis AM13 = DSM 14728]